MRYQSLIVLLLLGLVLSSSLAADDETSGRHSSIRRGGKPHRNLEGTEGTVVTAPPSSAVTTAETQTPSLNPTTTALMMSLEPTTIDVLHNITCYDYPGWEDTEGDNCTVYEKKNNDKCSQAYLYRNSSNNNMTATDACCACLGGYRNDGVGSSEIEIGGEILVPSLSPTIECHDYPGWKDVYNYTCAFYEKQDICWWKVPGIVENATASEACCYCQGGHSDGDLVPSFSPTVKCYDYPGWKDKIDRGCDHSAAAKCNPKYANSQNISALDACCICDGGYRDGAIVPSFAPTESMMPSISYLQQCNDFPFWYDIDGPKFNCTWYGQENKCALYGDAYTNMGHTANTACCACSNGIIEGGYTDDEIIIPLPTISNSTNSTNTTKFGSTRQDTCYDYYNWTTASGMSCASYELDVELDDALSGQKPCSLYGHFVSNSTNGFSASKACCACGGGDKVFQNKMLRVGYPVNVSDDGFTLTMNMTTGNRSGTFYNFMVETLEDRGFGLVEKKVSEEAKMAYPNDPFTACTYDISKGKLDFCMGPFPNVTTIPINASKNVYKSQFYLVVKKAHTDWTYYAFIPFRTFSLQSWFMILLIILVAGCSLEIVKNGCSESCLQREFCFRRLGNIIFNPAAQFFGKDGIQPDAEGPEKVIIFGFAFFTLFVVTYFASTITSVVLEELKIANYESLNDVVEENAVLCVPHILVSAFLQTYPETFDALYRSGDFTDRYHNATMLLDLLQEGTCEAVVITDIDYEAAGGVDSDYCKQTVILRDNVLLNIDIIIPFGSVNSHGNRHNSSLDEYGYNVLFDRTNRMIDSGWFTALYEADRRNVMKNSEDSCKEQTLSNDYPVLNDGVTVPAVFSIFLCIVGIGVWWRKATVNLNEEMNEEESSAFIRMKLSKMSAFELYSLLMEGDDIDEKALSDAMKLLPDKSGLLKIAEDIHAFDDYEAEKSVLKQLELEDLVAELTKCNKRDFDGAHRGINETIEEALEEKDGKKTLVNFILQTPNVRHSIIKHVRTQKRSSVYMSRRALFGRNRDYSLLTIQEDDTMAVDVNQSIEGDNTETRENSDVDCEGDKEKEEA